MHFRPRKHETLLCEKSGAFFSVHENARFLTKLVTLRQSDSTLGVWDTGYVVSQPREAFLKIVATRGEIFSLKFTKYRLATGLRPHPLGELKRSPRPPSRK